MTQFVMAAEDAVALLTQLRSYDVDEPLPDGSLHYGSVVDGVRFPAEALAGRGVIAGTAVRCEGATFSRF